MKEKLWHGWLVGGLATIVAHTGLILLFSIPDRTAEFAKLPTLQQVVMLPLNGKIPYNKRNLLNWLYYDNPEIFKPDLKIRFNSISGLRVPEADIPLITNRLSNPMSEEKGRFKGLPVSEEIPVKKVSRLWDYASAPVPIPLFSADARPFSEYPHWKDSSGKSLPQLFTEIESAKIKKEIEDSNPREATLLKAVFYSSSLFPRIKIVSSCGIDKLDKTAVKTLLIHFNRLASDYRQENKTCYIEIEWQRGFNK